MVGYSFSLSCQQEKPKLIILSRREGMGSISGIIFPFQEWAILPILMYVYI